MSKYVGRHRAVVEQSNTKVWSARVLAVVAPFVAMALVAAPASAATTAAQRGEGVIAITTRVCGSAAGWQNVAKVNGITGPEYLVRLGQKLTITCSKKTSPTTKTVPVAAPAKTGGVWFKPLASSWASSCYGPRWGTVHQGIDLAASYGTPIRAVTSGRVVSSGWAFSGYGISVVLDHGKNGLTHYAHMSKARYGKGKWVTAGTIIGWVGSTGDSTGPHLHFEHWLGWWKQENPAPWLRAHRIGMGC